MVPVGGVRHGKAASSIAAEPRRPARYLMLNKLH
jgi:hypothetical protein